MSPIRLGTFISALATATILSGCAIGGHPHSLSGNASDTKLGLATRAALAFQRKDYTAAVSLGEEAVASDGDDVTLRLLLANSYFAAGRFQSAETAYRETLSLQPNQPEVVLKLALAQIAQGKSQAALGYLDIAHDALDPSDYGLAVALAGRPADAVAILEPAARSPRADARVRQNLALAYGLAGDWAHARTVAAQDVSPDQLDARVQQWMQMASPTHASDQVAMLTGVTPVADPGEPVRLALKNAENPLERYAQAASQKIQQTATVMLPDPDPLEAAPSPIAPSAPQTQTAAAPEPHWLPEAAPEPMAEAAPEAIPEPVVASAAKSLVKPAVAPVVPLPTKFEEASKPSYIAITDEVRKAAQRARTGKSSAVVQIGAYSSPQRVQAAWNDLSRRYPGLNRYRPVSARFVSAKGTFYRLAIKGFADSGDAQDMCSSLRGKGKTCFVRRVAGDSPVEMASR